MTSQAGQQIITIHLLSNISKSKDNDVMNFVLEKSYPKCGGETSPWPFSKTWKLSISLDKQSKVLYSLFFCIYWYYISSIL